MSEMVVASGISPAGVPIHFTFRVGTSQAVAALAARRAASAR
jgi:hypothetical protein